jgi:hypothetical protein
LIIAISFTPDYTPLRHFHWLRHYFLSLHFHYYHFIFAIATPVEATPYVDASRRQRLSAFAIALADYSQNKAFDIEDTLRH